MREPDPETLVTGAATRAGTARLASTAGAALPEGHYSDFLNLHLKLSSLGIGTFPGAASDAADADVAAIVERACLAGINVFDTAAHYRWGRAARALGAGLRRAFARGVDREGVFVVAKGGFLLFADGPPADLDAWFAREIAARGLGAAGQRRGVHLLSPAYLAWQIDALRAATGLATLDAFLIDQPELHIPAIGKEAVNRRLEQCFAVCEQAVRQDKIRCYGIATFEGFRVETDDALFESLASLLGLAERAAQRVHADRAQRHALRMVTLPFNVAMTEGFTRFNQATGQGNVASTVQAAHQLRVFVAASHGLMKGRLAAPGVDPLALALPEPGSAVRRALQFNRSTPGIGVSLVGISSPAHLDDLLAVARMPPLPRERYLGLYRRSE